MFRRRPVGRRLVVANFAQHLLARLADDDNDGARTGQHRSPNNDASHRATLDSEPTVLNCPADDLRHRLDRRRWFSAWGGD